MRCKRKIFVILLTMLAIGTTAMSCKNLDDSYTDTIPPSNVEDLMTVGADGSVVLNWIDPGDTDLSYIVIETGGNKIVVNPGVKTYTFTGLTNELAYQYKIYTVDKNGNSSTTKTVSGVPTVFNAWVLVYFKSEGSYDSSSASKAITQNSLYLAYSTNGLDYISLNNNAPVYTTDSGVGSGGQCIRDPYIFRRKDGDSYKFVLLATDWTPFNKTTTSYWGVSSPKLIIADSNDLITWENERCVQIAPYSTWHAWAPEVIYDSSRSTNPYGVIWSGNGNLANTDSINRTYVNWTSDFTTFEDAELYFELRGTDGSAITEIDATVVNTYGKNYMFYKGETSNAKDIQEACSSSLEPMSFTIMNNGHYITRTNAQNTAVGIEGPFVVNVNGIWWLFGDHYGSTSTTSTKNFYGYSCGDIAADASKWTSHANDGTYSFPAGVRHANTVRIKAAELMALKNAW